MAFITQASQAREEFFSTSSITVEGEAALFDLVSQLEQVPCPLPTSLIQGNASAKKALQLSLEETYLRFLELAPHLGEHSFRHVLSSILTVYGRTRYEEAYDACMVFQRASLQSQLGFPLSFDPTQSKNLEELEQVLKEHVSFQSFDHYVRTLDMDNLAQQLSNRKEADKVRLGFTLKWLTNGLHHTVGFKPEESAENIERLEKLYTLGRGILESCDSIEAEVELKEMYYDGLSRMVLEKDPQNIKDAHALLDQAKDFSEKLINKSSDDQLLHNWMSEMPARVANLKSCDYQGQGNLEEAKKYLLEAIEVRQNFSQEAQNPFLVANLKSRLSGLLSQEKKYDEALKVIDEALDYAEKKRGGRDPITGKVINPKDDHQYHGLYNVKKGKIYHVLGKYLEAINEFKKGLETFGYHEQDSQKFIEQTQALLEASAKELSKGS